MSYTLHTDIKAKSVSFGSKRTASAIKYIVLHYTGNKTDTAKNNAKYYRDTNIRAAGAHYFVDGTDVYQSIDDLRVAWAVGGAKYSDCASTGGGKLYKSVTNANSISIEMCSTAGAISAATFTNALALTRTLMAKYSVPAANVCRHFDVSGKHCPAYSTWMGSNPTEWYKFKSCLNTSAYTYKGTDYARVFNASYYAENNADVKKALGTDASTLFNHFCTYGMKEGRRAISSFNVSAYKANNADLVKAYGDDLPSYYKHYCVYGYKENRKAV